MGQGIGGIGMLPVFGSRNANWLGTNSIRIQLCWPLRRPRRRCFESSFSPICGAEYVELNTQLVLVMYQYVSSNNAYIIKNPSLNLLSVNTIALNQRTVYYEIKAVTALFLE